MGTSKSQAFSTAQNKMAMYAKALAHPARIAIMQLLLKQQSCICGSIVNELPLSQSTVSQHLKELKADFGLDFEAKVLFTRFDGRESSSHEILQSCTAEFDEMLMKSYVRTSTDIKNTIGSSKNIYRSKSAAKEDYDLVTRELLGI